MECGRYGLHGRFVQRTVVSVHSQEIVCAVIQHPVEKEHDVAVLRRRFGNASQDRVLVNRKYYNKISSNRV